MSPGWNLSLIHISGRESRLRKALASVQKDYDFIFVDCPPSLDPVSYTHLDVYKRQSFQRARAHLCSP